MTDLIAGRTDASSAGTPPLMPHIKAGKLRPIAVGMPQRIAALPDVPTVAEQGYKDFETSQWYGLLVRSKTPEAIVNRLSAEAAKAVKSQPVTDRFAPDNAIAVGSTPEEFADFIRKEQARWSDVVRKAKIKAE